MSNIKAKWQIASAAMVAAVSMTGCNSGSGGTAPPSAVTPPPPAQNVEFSVFAQQAFGANANSPPASLDGVTFTFDVNNDPSAFDALIMSGAFW